MSVDTLKQRVVAAAQASFLPAKDKEDLIKSVKKELKLLGRLEVAPTVAKPTFVG